MKFGSLSLLRQDFPLTDTEGEHGASTLRTHAVRIQIIGQLTCILTVVALWPQVSQPLQLALWWLGMSFTQFILSSLSHPLRRPGHEPMDDLSLHHFWSSASAVIAGGAWGALPLVGTYDATLHAQMIVFMTLGGITLAGAGILSGSRSTYAIFVVATLLPLFILSIVAPPAALPEASLWLTLFVMFAFTLNDILNKTRQVAAYSRQDAGEATVARQSMFEHSSEAIALSRRFRIVHSNRRFAALMHEAHSDLAGTRLESCFEHRQEWRRHARSASRALRRGDVYRETARLRRPDGSVFWARIAGQAVNPGGTPLQVVWTVSDITEQMASTTREALASQQLHALIGHSADWYWETDAQHRLVRLTCHAGQPDDTLRRNIGRQWWQFQRFSRSARAEQAAVRRSFEGGQGFRDLMVEVPDGDRPPLWLNICGTPRVNEHGSFLGHHGIATNVTEEVRRNERIHHLAYHDALTGLPNRRLLADRLTQAIAHAHRHRGRVGVLLLDLDNFKRINDLGGRIAGDRVLLETADRLRSCVRSCDTVARLGCDVFVVQLSELELATDASQVATKILHALHQPIAHAAPRMPLSTSIGIAIFPDDALSTEALLEIADARMYRAKRRGGQRIEHALAGDDYR